MLASWCAISGVDLEGFGCDCIRTGGCGGCLSLLSFLGRCLCCYGIRFSFSCDVVVVPCWLRNASLCGSGPF